MKEKKNPGGTEIRNKQIHNYRDFNTTFSVIELIDRWSKMIEELDSPNNLLDLIDIYRTLPSTREYTWLSSAHGTFSKKYISYHKESLKF